MRLTLEQSAESVCTQDLQGPEKDKLSQVGKEIFPAYHRIVRLGLEIGFGQFLFELWGVAGPCLPDE